MTVTLDGPTTVAQTFGLLPTSPGCSGGPSGAVCAISLSAILPCAASTICYTASIKTFDAVVCAPNCVIPTGANELSAAQNVAFTVATGEANNVNITLGGIPANLTVTPLRAGYLQGDALGLKIWGPASQKLVVEADDADGNSIVGPGSPAISGSVTTSNLVVDNPSSRNPNLLTLRAATSGSPPVVSPALVSLRLSAAPTASSGGTTLVQSVPVTIAHSVLYVASSGISILYDGRIGTPNAVIAGAATMLSGGVQGICHDPGNNAIYATVASGTGIYGFAADARGNVAPQVAISGAATMLNGAYSCALDRHGTLYVGNDTANSVTEYAIGSNGNAAPSTTIVGPDTLLNAPVGIFVDAQGLIYVLNHDTASVTVYASSATGDAVPIDTITGSGTGLVDVASLAMDRSGTLYVGNFAGNSVTEYAPGAGGNASPIATISGPATLLFHPSGIAVDSSGALYAFSQLSDLINEYPPGANGDVAPDPSAFFGSAGSLSVVPAGMP
jgi:hypothetical protein